MFDAKMSHPGALPPDPPGKQRSLATLRSEPEEPGEPAVPRPAGDRRSSRARLTELLAHADIVIDGDRPWDPKVADERFFDVAFAGSLAVGEGYMDGLWDVERVDELVCRFRRANLDERF